MIVFDIDGTILPGTSCEKLFVRYLVDRKIIGIRQSFNFCLRAITLLPKSIYHVTKANKGYLRNFDTGYMSAIGKSFFESHVQGRLSPRGIERVNQHKKNGDRVVLLSGMPDFLIDNFSSYLQVDESYGSILERRSGQFTGRTLGPFPLAEGKVEALKLIIRGGYSAEYFNSEVTPNSAESAPFDWKTITFYGDHWLDRFLLQKVGNPIAVNPGKKLRELATEKNWAIEIFGP